jgi:hypothetical protein
MVHAAAARGTSGASEQLPHQDRIQASFGRHDVSNVKAHVGGAAKTAGEAMGAVAYATGNSAVFTAPPDLHTAAHEAAHVVQQRGGVSLKEGVGKAGDHYEQHADAVADLVVAGGSSEALLDEHAGGCDGAAGAAKGARTGATHAIQAKPLQMEDASQAEEITAAVYDLQGGGKRPYDVMQDYISSVCDTWNTMLDYNLAAIEQFVTIVSYPALAETKPDLAGTLLSSGVAVLIGRAVSIAGGILPGVGVAKALVTTIQGEVKRAAARLAEYNEGSFISSLRENTVVAHQKEKGTLRKDGGNVLLGAFIALGEAQGENAYQEGDRGVVGEQGQFLLDLDSKADRFLGAAPTLREFEQTILESWIPTDPDLTSGHISIVWDVYPAERRYELAEAKLKCVKSGQVAAELRRIITEFDASKVKCLKTVEFRNCREGIIWDDCDPYRSARYWFGPDNDIIERMYDVDNIASLVPSNEWLGKVKNI